MTKDATDGKIERKVHRKREKPEDDGWRCRQCNRLLATYEGKEDEVTGIKIKCSKCGALNQK